MIGSMERTNQASGAGSGINRIIRPSGSRWFETACLYRTR